MIRPATLADREKILDMVGPYINEYPLRIDSERMMTALTQSISTAKHFAWVHEAPTGVDGVLLALTGENLWAQRQNCNVVAWIAETPGTGAALLRKFRDWVKSRRAIKVAGMAPDMNGIDERAWKLAERIGFERHGGAYLLYN